MSFQDLVVPTDFPIAELKALFLLWQSGEIKTKWLEALGKLYLVIGYFLTKTGAFARPDDLLVVGVNQVNPDYVFSVTPDVHSDIEQMAIAMGIAIPAADASSGMGPILKMILVEILKKLAEQLLSREVNQSLVSLIG